MNLDEKRKRLYDQVESSRKEIRADRMDMSFGEIMNMYDEGELIIAPEFQRAFRWGKDKQTKFIESLILGIPIPPIFVAETKGNVWELVDGLQRISTVLSFFGKLKDKEKNDIETRLLATTRYKTIECIYDVDQSLIGGMVIKMGDRVVDRSIRTKLGKLQKELLAIQM